MIHIVPLIPLHSRTFHRRDNQCCLDFSKKQLARDRSAGRQDKASNQKFQEKSTERIGNLRDGWTS